MEESRIAYILGKSAEDNWNIYRNSELTDVIFHLDKFSSPYVIINVPINELTKEQIQMAASMCKSNSKYKNLKNLGVMYTSISNTKLGDTVGSFIILRNKLVKTIHI